MSASPLRTSDHDTIIVPSFGEMAKVGRLRLRKVPTLRWSRRPTTEAIGWGGEKVNPPSAEVVNSMVSTTPDWDRREYTTLTAPLGATAGMAPIASMLLS